MDQGALSTAGFVYFFVLATGMLGLGAFLIVRAVRFYARAVLTTGSVIGWRPEWDSDARTNYAQHPIIAYQSADGRNHELVAEVLGPDEKLPIGHRIKVRYDPDAPDIARRANSYIVFAGPLALVVMSVFVFAMLSGELS